MTNTKKNGADLIQNTSAARRRAARRRAAEMQNGGGWFNIWQAYQRPSRDKVQAWYRIADFCVLLDGYDLRIVGASSFAFSVLFRFRVDGREAVAYITRDYDSFAYLD